MDSCDDVKSNSSLEDALAQLDISGPLVCGLLNKMLHAILAKLEVPYVMRYRLVNKGWNVLIENICRDKKCLLMMFECRFDDYGSMSYSQLFTELNGHLKVGQLVFVQPTALTIKGRFSGKICTIMAKLFPRIEQFCTGRYSSYDNAAFNSLLQVWSPSLTTLSLSLNGYMGVGPQPLADLCAQVNKLTNLKNLNLSQYADDLEELLGPTWPRLEHFSGWFCEEMTKVVPFLGDGCTSVGMFSVTLDEIAKWQQVKPQFVSNLVRFSQTFDAPDWSSIWEHFTSLQMLSICPWAFNCKLCTAMIEPLAQLSHLTELRISRITFYASSFDVAILTPLPNIQVFYLLDFYFGTADDVGQCCRILSTIFPNLHKLILKGSIKEFGNTPIGPLLEPHLNLFANLRSHEFGPKSAY